MIAGDRSRIIAPDGEIEAEAPYVALGERPESFLLVKSIMARKRFERARHTCGNFLRDRRPNLYGALVDRS